VSLGNFLIKRVAEELQRELPQLKTFCTLSPMPGFSRWLRAGALCDGLPKARAERLAQALAAVTAATGKDFELLGSAATLRALAPEVQQSLLQLGAFYLACDSSSPSGDPVARFHLDNGARLERLNPLADLSSKGVKQSSALMVNYLYDLQKIESHHEKFTRGEVAHSRAVAALL
jgi:malonyl-CoA decarboxylase